MGHRPPSLHVLPVSRWPTNGEALRSRYVGGEVDVWGFEAQVGALLAAGEFDSPSPLPAPGGLPAPAGGWHRREVVAGPDGETVGVYGMTTRGEPR